MIKKLPLPLQFLALALPVFSTSPVQSEDVQSGMKGLLGPLRELQRYMADEERFTDPQNNRTVSYLLQEMRSHFHTMETVPSRYHSLDGFTLSMQQVTDLLDDASRRFHEGKATYAWWRLKSLPSSCFACHATYKISSSISAEDAIDPSLDTLQQGRFLLATRQFMAAKEKLLQTLKNPAFRFHYDEALRSLLLITTRIEKSPQAAITLFQTILATSKLPEEDIHQVRGWLEALKKWKNSSRTTKHPLSEGESLIVSGAVRGLEVGRDDVSLLRGTALLHSALESQKLTTKERSKALYLLGFAYEQLPLFFAESWAEMYLEQCIYEFPGTEDAQRAFRVYREHIANDFTGSGGTDIPDEVFLHLDELRKKAFGEPSLNGKV